jgi:DNA-directed RNA polymerase specialized sigma24 family protein
MGNCDRKRFDREFQILLDSGSSTGCTMLSSIQRSLWQFNLQNLHTAPEILIEAYVRGCKFIDSEGQINDPIAWTRTTAFNVIRELSRERKRKVQTENQTVDERLNVSLAPFEDLSEEYKLIMAAFSSLTSEEQELLTLKVIERLSWRAIRDHLSQKYDKDLTEDALRKRKERILKRLHQNYHSLKSISNEVVHKQNI